MATTKELFTKQYNNVKQQVIESMDKALTKALEDGAIDFENAYGNYRDVYPLIGAILEKNARECIYGGSTSTHREMRRKANWFKKLQWFWYC